MFEYWVREHMNQTDCTLGVSVCGRNMIYTSLTHYSRRIDASGNGHCHRHSTSHTCTRRAFPHTNGKCHRQGLGLGLGLRLGLGPERNVCGHGTSRRNCPRGNVSVWRDAKGECPTLDNSTGDRYWVIRLLIHSGYELSFDGGVDRPHARPALAVTNATAHYY